MFIYGELYFTDRLLCVNTIRPCHHVSLVPWRSLLLLLSDVQYRVYTIKRTLVLFTYCVIYIILTMYTVKLSRCQPKLTY